MTYQPAMALDEPRINSGGDPDPSQKTPGMSRLGTLVTRIGEKGSWMFRRSEAVGWLLALALNISAAGWMGLGIWTFIFATSILLETVAEPVDAAE